MLTAFRLTRVIEYSARYSNACVLWPSQAVTHTRDKLHRLTVSGDAPVVCIQKARVRVP
jgi:hypothetical protein